MTDRTTIVLTALTIALRNGEPCVLLDERGRLPATELPPDQTDVIQALQSILVRTQRSPLSRAVQLPASIVSTTEDARTVTIAYLITTCIGEGEGGWIPCYTLLPWEDRRSGNTQATERALADYLSRSVDNTPTVVRTPYRRKLDILFGMDGWPWRPEMAHERYTALHSTGMGFNTLFTRDRRVPHRDTLLWLARGLTHLRTDLRSMIMPPELMPDRFTLQELRKSFDGVTGERSDPQVFRRAITSAKILSSTPGISSSGSGRPSMLFRFQINFVAVRAEQTLLINPTLSEERILAETIDTLFDPEKAYVPNQGIPEPPTDAE